MIGNTRKTAAPTRISTRTVVVSKSMRIVDADTRKEVREQRLLLLEQDNYIEEIELFKDDDAYEDISDDGKGPSNKRRKKKDTNKSLLLGMIGNNTWLMKKVKPLERVLFEAGYHASKPSTASRQHIQRIGNNGDSDDGNDNQSRIEQVKADDIVTAAATAASQIDSRPNYVAVAATPSILPPRHFCSICGQVGQYACIRCGRRSCCIECMENHQTNSCMKTAY